MKHLVEYFSAKLSRDLISKKEQETAQQPVQNDNKGTIKAEGQQGIASSSTSQEVRAEISLEDKKAAVGEAMVTLEKYNLDFLTIAILAENQMEQGRRLEPKKREKLFVELLDGDPEDPKRITVTGDDRQKAIEAYRIISHASKSERAELRNRDIVEKYAEKHKATEKAQNASPNLGREGLEEDQQGKAVEETESTGHASDISQDVREVVDNIITDSAQAAAKDDVQKSPEFHITARDPRDLRADAILKEATISLSLKLKVRQRSLMQKICKLQ